MGDKSLGAKVASDRDYLRKIIKGAFASRERLVIGKNCDAN